MTIKRFISVLCVITTITSMLCFTASSAEPVVSFSLEAAPVYDGDITLEVDLIVTLPEGATGYELGSFGIDVTYDRTLMKLAEEPLWKVDGSCFNPEELSAFPYTFVWTSVKPQEQFKPGSTVAATMVFELAKPAIIETEYAVDIAVNPNFGASSMLSMDGTYSKIVYTEDQLSVNGATAVVLPIHLNPERPSSPEDATLCFTLDPKPVCEGDTAIEADLVITLPEDATGYELGAFGLKVNYDSSVMKLAKEPLWEIKGNCMNDDDIDKNPFLLLWVTIKTNEQLKPGSTVAATLTFDLAEPAKIGDAYKISLSADKNNPISSMASKDGTFAEIAYPGNEVYILGADIVAREGIDYGDTNGDGGINLSDISLMLKYIAKWEDLTIDVDAADVNDDGMVNLFDVSHLLKYLAKWEGFVPGPTR